MASVEPTASALRLVVDGAARFAAVWEQISCTRALSNEADVRRHINRGGSLEDLLRREGFAIRWLPGARSELAPTHDLYKKVTELLATARMLPDLAHVSHAFARSEWSVVHLVRVECRELRLAECGEQSAAEPALSAGGSRAVRPIAPLGAA